MVNKLRCLALCLIIVFSNITWAQSAQDETFYEGDQDDRYFEAYTGGSDSDQNSEAFRMNDSGYRLVNTDKGLQFIQRLVWEDAGTVDHYSITIQELDSRTKKYVTVEEQDSVTNFTEVSLAAGTYRYKIIIYNVLGRAEIETEWAEFTIEVAYEPRISDTTPGAFYMEEEPDGNMTISGRNIRNNARIELRREGKKGGGYKADKIEISSRGNKANLHFNLDTIVPGKYSIVVTNPGGLSAKSQTVVIRYKKPMDFDLSAGYALNVVLFDDTFSKNFEGGVFPLSFAAKATFIPVKTPYGYFGAGILADYTFMQHTFDSYKLSGNMISGHLNFVYQKPFFQRKFFIEAFAGAGAVYFMNYVFEFENNIKSPETSSMNISIDAGIAAQYYFTKRLFMDVTIPFIYAFTKDMNFGSINPQITVGWQF